MQDTQLAVHEVYVPGQEYRYGGEPRSAGFQPYPAYLNNQLLTSGDTVRFVKVHTRQGQPSNAEERGKTFVHLWFEVTSMQHCPRPF